MLGDAAAQLIAAHRGGMPVTAPLPAPPTRAAAYAIQDRVVDQIGPAGAWKVGRNASDPDPYIAPVPRAMISLSGAPRALPRGAPRIGVEAELGFRLSTPVHPGSPPADAAANLTHVGHVVPLLELLATRLPSGTHDPAGLWKLADNQATGGIVLGPDVPWQGQDLGNVHVQWGVGDWSGSWAAHPFGDPGGMLHWALVHLAGRGGAPAGTIITTGSYTGITQVAADETFSSDFSDFGRVAVTLRAAPD
ncbi:fumarylacetoacetate hydrolase family protein [Oceanibium sediminis]|uniref:fumarylacetoacetate hydrolase family protein n=1 Tax=Oceanibium sediminis TaxID=2026339 RepID=UPI0013005292|nr:fumarylacetoacetate hydrolase family protein [Oceanibium sediminis]